MVENTSGRSNMKKHILFIMPDLPSGGAEKVLIDILRNFDYKLYDVTLLLKYRQGVYLNDIPSAVRLRTMFGASNIWVERWHRLLGIMHCYHLYHSIVHKLVLLFTLHGLKFDTIVSFMEGEAVRLHSYIVGKATKNVSWVHIDLKTKHWSKVFFRSDCQEQDAYEKMDRIVFVSQEAKVKFLELFGIDAGKCCVQYNLIDSATIRELALSKDVKKEKLTVCMVGRLNGQKRYDRALRVVKRLKEEGLDFVLWILGEGELEIDIERQIKEYALEDTVLLKGFVSPPYPYLAKADMFLSTSDSEGFSLVIAEAFCLGIPVVSTKTAGPVELIGDSEFGILVDDDIDSIYQGVKRILCNKKLREYYSEKSIERSMLFQVNETMEQIYSKL